VPTTNPLATLWGKIAKPLLPKRGQQQQLRFLCPNCLHFGGFAFACGECWSELPEYANGKNTQTCPRCQRSLLSADEDRIRAYCQQCKANYNRATYHQRQVRVLATLRPDDSQSLYRAVTGQEYQPQGGKGYVYDDGARLIYVLNLSDFTDGTHSLSHKHALWEAESIWLDMSASKPKELALELGEAADRFIAQAKLAEAQRRAMTVCVRQAESDPVVKPVLETRFGKVRSRVTAPAFLCERVQTKVEALEEIGHGSTVPALIVALKDSDRNVREKAAEALIKIGKAAVPALIVALKGSNWRVLSKVAEALNAKVNKLGLLNAEVNKLGLYLAPEMLENMSLDWAAPTASIGGPVDEWLVKDALVRIGKPAVPPLIAALKDSDSDVRQKAAEALGRIDDDSAVPALKAADREHHVCFNCDFCEALGRLGAK
jgi:hypothetical protein